MRLLATLLSGCLLLTAADPWKEKKPADWTDKDAKRILTNSPWARFASVDMPGSGMGPEGGLGGGGGRGRGGGMGGGMGGGPVGMEPRGAGTDSGDDSRIGQRGGPPLAEAPKITIRWESAEPVREAWVRAENPQLAQIRELAKEFYVISVSGAPPMGPGGRGRPQPDPDRMKQMQERMKESTLLKRKGRDPIAPARIHQIRGAEGVTTLFLFPRTEAITAEDKELAFETLLGPMSVKTKFSLKDMQFDGKLAL